MLIDGAGSAQALDKSGERVLLQGLDITDYVQQRAPLVYEHKAGAKGTSVDTVGRVLSARKVFTKEDCEDERQKMYWDKIRMPFLYVVARIHDGYGNIGADALVAEIRAARDFKEPKLLGFSVGGHVVDRDGHLLTSCVGRELTLTYKPANALCEIEELPEAGMTKSEAMILTWGPFLEVDPEIPGDLAKAYDSGGTGDVAPSAMVGMTALKRESLKGTAVDLTKDEVAPAPIQPPPPLPHQAPGDRLLSGSPALERLVSDLRNHLHAIAGPQQGHQLWPGGPEIRRVSMVGEDGDLPLGRIMLMDGHLQHLEDYHGTLARLAPEGPIAEDTLARLHVLETSPHVKYEFDHEFPVDDEVTPHGAPEEAPDLSSEPAPDLSSEVPRTAEDGPPPAEVYRYRRVGSTSDAVLEVSGDQAYLNGTPLSPALLGLIMQNVRLGSASLAPEGLAKSELEKADNKTMDPDSALQHVRAAVKAGHVHPDVERALTAHIFGDKMVPGIGNKYAFSQFRKKNKPGIYISGDGNDFRHLNLFGHDVGDSGITAMGEALRNAAKESLGTGPGSGKLFRSGKNYPVYRAGGDEFSLHMPSYEHAVKFLVAAHKHLSAIPPVNGTHQISMSFGVGHTPEQSDQALLAAKKQKLNTRGKPKYKPGQAPNLAHSLVTGKVGPVKLHTEAPPPTVNNSDAMSPAEHVSTPDSGNDQSPAPRGRPGGF